MRRETWTKSHTAQFVRAACASVIERLRGDVTGGAYRSAREVQAKIAEYETWLAWLTALPDGDMLDLDRDDYAYFEVGRAAEG